MIDIIMPVYKDSAVIHRTLMSMNDSKDIATITIVCDGIFNNISDEIAPYKENININLVQMCNNVGQGMARQYGVDNSKEENIFFIDCGDLIYSPYSLYEWDNDHLGKDVFFWRGNAVWKRNTIIPEKKEDNEFFFTTLGCFVKRWYLDKYNIRFSTDPFCSHNYEDAGWNNILLLINKLYENTYQYVEEHNRTFIKIEEENSVLTRDPYKYEYFDHTEGFLKNSLYNMHYFKKIRRTIDSNLFDKEMINEVTFALYATFCRIRYSKSFKPEWEKHNYETFEKYFNLLMPFSNKISKALVIGISNDERVVLDINNRKEIIDDFFKTTEVLNNKRFSTKI